MKIVDMNSDLGESFGLYTIGNDRAVLEQITSANIACGWHGGDPLIMRETVAIAREKGVAVGAHPGFNDLMGFGRRNMDVTPREFKAYIQYQIGALSGMASAEGMTLQHVKVHGAMYNMAAGRLELARALAEAVYEVDPSLILMGLAHSHMITEGQKLQLKTASEVFADRAYTQEGLLVPRQVDGAVIHDAQVAIERTVKMVKEGVVQAITGEWIPIEAQSICVHGDNPEALVFVSQIKAALLRENIQVQPLGAWL